MKEEQPYFQDNILFVLDSCVLIKTKGHRLNPLLHRVLIPTMVKFELGTKPGRARLLSFLYSIPALHQLTMDGRIIPFSAQESIQYVVESKERIRSQGNDEAILDACRMCRQMTVLVTDDINMRLKARCFGVAVCSSTELLVHMQQA